MNTQLPTEEKHNIVKNELLGNLKKKSVLELEITRQCKQLKRIEIQHRILSNTYRNETVSNFLSLKQCNRIATLLIEPRL
jgi:hypothetical protein